MWDVDGGVLGLDCSTDVDCWRGVAAGVLKRKDKAVKLVNLFFVLQVLR